MNKESSGLAFLQGKVPRISMEKLHACVFDGAIIRKDSVFVEAPSAAELSTWLSLKSTVTNFLVNRQKQNTRK